MHQCTPASRDVSISVRRNRLLVLSYCSFALVKSLESALPTRCRIVSWRSSSTTLRTSERVNLTLLGRVGSVMPCARSSSRRLALRGFVVIFMLMLLSVSLALYLCVWICWCNTLNYFFLRCQHCKQPVEGLLFIGLEQLYRKP
jgi:hypothetical protein